MNKYILYIEETLVDLKPGQTIATTIQRVDFGTLSNRKVNRTNRVVLPRTEVNDLVFGMASSEKSTSLIPYSVLSCRLEINGCNMFQDGICYLLEYDEDVYSVAILENVFDFFLSIKGKYLSAFNPITNSSWAEAGRDTARLNTSGIISAILNWGRGIYSADFFLPCFFYHTVITSILESSDLIVEGDILSDTDFTGMVIPFAGDKFEYNPALIDSITTNGYDPDGHTLSFPATGDRVTFTQYLNIVNNVLWDFSGSGQFVNSTPLTFPLLFTGTVTVNNIVWDVLDPASGVRVNIKKNIGGVISTLGTSNQINYPSTSGTLTVVITTGGGVNIFEPGAQLYVDYEILGFVGAIATLETTEHLGTTGFNSTVNPTDVIWNLLWPEIKADDILLDFTIRFGIIYKQMGNRLILKTIEAICQDKANAVDWTDKRVNSKSKKIIFKSNYGQENQFNHSDNIDNQEIGRGVFTIPNTILDPIKSLFTSPAGNTVTETTGSYYRAATIPAYDADSASIFDIVSLVGFRVLTLRDRGSDNAVTFNVTPRTDFKVAYFINAEEPKDTGFQYFVSKYYGSLTTALQRNKIVTKKYLLTELDISNYDPHKLIYDDGSYFIVNKINNYIPGKVADVELFKIL